MINLNSTLQLMGLRGFVFYDDAIKGGGNSLRHVSEATLNESSQGP